MFEPQHPASQEPLLNLVFIEVFGTEVEYFHNCFVGTGDNAMLVPNGPECVVKPAGAEEVAAEIAGNAAKQRNYIFRGDDNYRGGPVGRALGAEADAVDIQNFADHVLRKQSNLSSRYVSFTEEVEIARKFTSASDNRYVSKAELAALRELEAQGIIRIWNPDRVYAALRAGPRKLAKQAADVRAAMKRNSEILIEGQIPAGVLQSTN